MHFCRATKMRAALVSVVLLLGSCQSLIYYRLPANPLSYYRYTVNEIADTILPIVSTVIRTIGLDPLSVPSITDNFDVSLLSFNRTLNVHLPSGNLSKLAVIKRYGNTSLFFRDNQIYFRIGVVHSHLQGRFHYNVYTFPVTLRGITNVTIYDATTTMYFAYDWHNSSLSLKSISIEDIRSFVLDLDNDSAFDQMSSTVANKLSPALKRKIIEFGERMAAAIISRYIGQINAELERKINFLNELRKLLDLQRGDRFWSEAMNNISQWLRQGNQQ